MMVNLTDIKKFKSTKRLVNCRIEEIYIQELKKREIRFTDFVNQAFKETFPNIGKVTKK